MPVASNTRLLPPERLFLRLRDNLTPFAYELPAAFTAHTGVLQELGMKQEPTASDLVKLVVVRHSSSGFTSDCFAHRDTFSSNCHLNRMGARILGFQHSPVVGHGIM